MQTRVSYATSAPAATAYHASRSPHPLSHGDRMTPAPPALACTRAITSLSFRMDCKSLHVGMRVRHPVHGHGTIKAVSESSADILFGDQRRTVDPVAAEIEPAEPLATASGLSMPLAAFIQQTVASVADRLGIHGPEDAVHELGTRWRKGRLVLHPADPALATKEVDLEQFFHKIVMVRNNLRLLEQKINASTALDSADKFDCQQYITRCYGSLTTFNILFKDKESQFTGAKS